MTRTTRMTVQATLAFELPDDADLDSYADALTTRINELARWFPANATLTIGTVFTDASAGGHRPPLEITDGMRRLVLEALRGDSLPGEFAALSALAAHVGIDPHAELIATP